ncbi:MAG: PKD domain-containing protein [Thermoplasmata archaeon]
MTYDAADGYVVMFTGSPFVPSPETWEFHADKWTQLAGATPPLTAGEQLVYDTALHEAILFGGVVPGSGGWFEYNFTWAWSHGAWANISGSLRVSPSGRDSYGLVYDSSSSELVLFGGARTTHLLNDTWTFGTGGWTNVTSQVAPQPRVEVAMADDPANGTILLFGGQNVTTTAWGLGDTWAWSGVTDNWSLVYGSLSVSSLRASSNPAIFGAPVNFTSTVSGGTPPYTYAWAFGDGATGGDLPNITHAYTTNGPFRVILAVTDAVGDTARGYINVTILLQAQVQASVTSGAPPLAVRFGGTAVGGAPPYAFTWDFGDGSPVSHSEDTAHTYNGSGVYTVVLTVRDSQGEEATHTLEVKTSGAGFLGLPNGEGYSLVGALIVAVLAVSLFAGRRVISARATEAAERGKGDAFREYRESLNIRDEGPVDTLAPGQTDPAEDIF